MNGKYREYLCTIGMGRYIETLPQAMPSIVIHNEIKKEIFTRSTEATRRTAEVFLSKIGYQNNPLQLQFVKKASDGDIEACNSMLANGNININANTDNGTALISATKNEHVHICKFLLERGASINCYDISKKTPLMYAARSGNIEICELFMTHQPNIDIPIEYIVGPHGYMLRQCIMFADKNQREILNLFIRYRDKFNVGLFDGEEWLNDPSPKDLINYRFGCKLSPAQATTDLLKIFRLDTPSNEAEQHIKKLDELYLLGESSNEVEGSSWGCSIS